jgi:DNA-directed RNA polymerase II subunit RPB2
MTTESLSKEGLQFLEKYFAETDFAMTRHHIDTYEHCMFNEIPTIIHTANPIVFLKEPLDKDAGVFKYRVELFIGGDAPTPDKMALTFSPPIITLDGGNTVRRMFPNEARLRNLTYATQVSADILIRVTFTRPRAAAAAAGGGGGPGLYETEVKEAPLIRGFDLFRMPILLRSSLCPTSVADPTRLEEMGECRNDYGGYFIVNGAEKVLITRGEQAFNSLYVEKKPESDDKFAAYASVVSLHPETKQTRRVALYMSRSGEIRAAIPMVRGAFPLFILFRAMGVESDEEIVRMIFPDIGDSDSMRLQSDLIPSIEDAYPIHNRYTATKYIMSLTKGFTEAHVLDILQNLMLPHVQDEPMARAQYLAEMAREVLRANAGLRPKTDRDDMRNQRFLPTGTLVRELFNGCWKDWRAEVILAIDRTYRANEQLYENDAVFDLFAGSNLKTLLQPTVLNNSIMRGYRGKWGTNERNEKTGVLQPLARISYLDSLSHTRRVVSDFDTGMKTTGPRKLHTSHVGYFCTSETPQGAHIGATKNISLMTQFSIGAPMKPVYDWMRLKGGVIPVADTTAAIRASAAVVQINGGTVGFTMNPRELVRVLRLFKWNAYMSPTASISFNTTDKTVRVLLDEGRPIRPLWHLNGEGSAFLARLPALRASSWAALVFGTSPAAATASMRTVQFLDPLGDGASFADYEALLTPTAGFIEYCDPVEMNENYISWWGAEGELTPDHTHAEIHPSTLTGLMASMIPYSNHNQAPRNQLSNSQSKQGIGYMSTAIHHRFDTYGHQLCYGEAPLCRTFAYETVANGEMPYGFNCIIAATSESGYNQDDGLILNRDSIARGMFQSLAFRSYDCAEELDPRTKVHSHVANPRAVPSWTSLRPGLDYSKLDERGIIREGEIIDDKTVLVGRYMVVPDTNDIKDASVTPGLYTKGRVDTVVVLHQGDGRMLVKVRIIEVRVPVLGDKFSSRHGQKGTIGMLIRAVDMPRTADGIVPDVMVNPGGLISRMTVAQLVEMVAGRAAAEVAAKFNATTFCNGGDFVKQLGDVLQQVGASRAGDTILYSGVTGEQIRTDIYMCPLYFMRLKHLTDDKVNSRGAGKREMRTHQPTGGRANEGGLRIGEMERDSLCSHGVSTFLQESMMKRGDATEFWICNGCGRIPIYNESESLFVCSTCDGPLEYTGVTPETLTMQLPTKQSRVTFSKIAMPYSMKLLDQELTTFMNAGFRFVTEGSVSRLRESGWEWPSIDVEFKAGERGVEAAAEVNPDARAAAEAEAAAAAAAAKPKRKKGGAATAVAGAEVGPVAGTEGAAAVLEAAAAAAGVAAAAGANTMAGAIRFYSRLKNEYIGFSNFAAAAFTMPMEQIPAPDGVEYPPFTGGSAGAAAAAGPAPTWPTVEHYYQAMKFPQDSMWQEAIRRADTPALAKKMGLSREHPLRGDWDQIKERVMKAALLAKFRQNPGLLALLQGTGDKPLVEASPGDSYWGAGPRGKGQNRTGALLAEVRAELKGVRVDAGLLAAAPEVGVEGEEDDGANTEPEDIVAGANAAVAAATGGVVQVVGGNGGAGNGVQGGGVYMFINSGVSDRVEAKARRARGGSRRAQHISWEGMSVEREGSDESSAIQGGGGAGVAGEAMTTDMGSAVEVKVEKLG